MLSTMDLIFGFTLIIVCVIVQVFHSIRSGQKKDRTIQREKKTIRRVLRALGHTGGLNEILVSIVRKCPECKRKMEEHWKGISKVDTNIDKKDAAVLHTGIGSETNTNDEEDVEDSDFSDIRA